MNWNNKDGSWKLTTNSPFSAFYSFIAQIYSYSSIGTLLKSQYTIHLYHSTVLQYKVKTQTLWRLRNRILVLQIEINFDAISFHLNPKAQLNIEIYRRPIFNLYSFKNFTYTVFVFDLILLSNVKWISIFNVISTSLCRL